MRKISNLLAKQGVSLDELKTLSSVASDIQSQLHAKFPKPGSVITVGSENCDYTSLATALDNASTGDTIIMFGSNTVQVGPFNLKENQRIVSFGRLTLKSGADGRLFNCYGSDGSDFHVYFRGDFYYELTNPAATNYIKIFSDGVDAPLNAFVYLHGVFFYCRFHWSQSGANNPNIQSFERNWQASGTALNPSALRDSAGLFFFNNLLPPSIIYNQSYFEISLLSLNTARTLVFEMNSGEANVLAFVNLDFTGALGDNCNGVCTVKTHTFFESA